MNKRLSVTIILAITCMIALTGCGKKPKAVVSEFCAAMQDADYEKMNECLSEPSDSVEDPFSSDEELSVFGNFISEQAKEMKYEIIDTDIDGDEAMVSVEFVYTDASSIVRNTFAQYFTQALGLAFSGASEDQMGNLLLDIFNQQLSGSPLIKTKETVGIKCVKKDKEWKIAEVSDDLINVLTCNILETFNEIGDSFEENSNDSGIPVEDITDTDTAEEIDYTYVSKGEEIQLASIKISVLDCSETKELKSDYSEDVAEDGTKFIVYTIKVENITTVPFEFEASDIPLMDSQGRYFNNYSDIYFTVDNYIDYRELSPNMPETGVMVYKVPEDSAGYGFCLQNADTEEAYCFLGR